MLRGRRYLTSKSASSEQPTPATAAYTIAMVSGATSTDTLGATNTDPFAAGWVSQTSYNTRHFPNSAGSYSSYASGVVARNDLGVWHREDHRLNLLKNNSMTGAGAGVLPTTWTETVAVPAGITRTISTGTDATLNLPYLDIAFSGTASATATYTLQFGANGDHGTRELKTVAVSAGGSGHAVNDVITLASTGGTAKVAATVLVTAVSGGAITNCEILNPGSFSVDPTSNPMAQASTSGVGTGATFTVTYGLMTGLQLSGWLQLTAGTLSKTCKCRLEGIFTTSAGGASGASQAVDDRVLNRDTVARRHKGVIVAPTPGTAALVKPSFQCTITSGETFNHTIRIIAPQLEPVTTTAADASQPIMTTAAAAFSRADIFSVTGGPLTLLGASSGAIELTTKQLSHDGLDHRRQLSMFKANGTTDLLQRGTQGQIQNGVNSAKTYRTYRANFALETTHCATWGGGSFEVASTANAQNKSSGGSISITSAKITADGCIKQLKVWNGKIGTATYNSVTKDVIVYGATSGGVVAAADAIRNGATACCVMRFREVIPGGMSASGLAAIDANDFAQFGGMSIDMLYYANELFGATGSPTSTSDPVPKYVTRYFDYLIKKYGVMLYPTRPGDSTVGGISTVTKSGVTKRISQFTTPASQTFIGEYFIDASYEGDLMSNASVTYVTGREAADTSTDANGAQKDPRNGNIDAQGGTTDSFGYSLYNFQNGSNSSYTTILTVDPWTIAGDSTSSRLSGVQADNPAAQGAADDACQAYTFRQTLTTTASIKSAFPSTEPTGYTPQQYELLGRWGKACIDAGKTAVAYNTAASSSNYSLSNLGIFNGIGGNAYYDINSGNAFSFDWFGSNWGAEFQTLTGSSASQYCEATNAERAIYWNKLKNYILGFWYYLQYDAANEVAALSATVNAGGTGYAVGDRIVMNVANTMFSVVARVSTVSSGAVTAVTIMGGVLTRGNSAPSNPISQSSTSGSGSGCTLNITWGSRIHSQIRSDALLFGLTTDTYNDYCEEDFTGWMPEMYLREGRRMTGVYKMHSSDVLPPIGGTVVGGTNTAGALSYAVDSHHVRRYAVNRSGTWRTECEGNIVVSRSGFNSYAPIPMECMLPQSADCTNLIVTFCVSATHPAFGAERMELSHMALSQSAGLLSAQLVAGASPDVQSYTYSTFRTAALAEGLVLPQTN